MENVNKDITLENTNAFFDEYFENMDLNEDLKSIYEIINDDELQNEFEFNEKLNKLRSENHKRYYDIEILKLNNLPKEFDEIIIDVKKLYDSIDSKKLLTEDVVSSQNSRKILNNIDRRMNRIDQMVKTTLDELTKDNENKQSKFSIQYFKNLDVSEAVKKQLLQKYNDLVLYNSVIVKDKYEDLKRQVVRQEYILDILKLLNIEEENKINAIMKSRLDILNSKIDLEINKHRLKLNYLNDIMLSNSIHKEEFEDFVSFYNKIIAYDDKNYMNAKQTYEILTTDSRLKLLFKNFEDMFIEEREKEKKEESFIYEKFGIKNIKTSLDYISSNYIQYLDEDDKKTIEFIYNELDKEIFDINIINELLKPIVKRIWKSSVTDVYSYNPNDDFCFICSNNQFIDEKYQTILITKKELQKVDDYIDYQIGFICSYNDNIMYITENEDIMTVKHDDMSNLKTPIQLEQEFINFRVCNRIALNGFLTKVEAVYFIDDGNKTKYKKAIELANMYKLPLIVLKKDN